ncbi:DEAD/DEAH box helicase family protein, partial [bacterium]|nr:DEAD/DEAH box helicase family protein [bacterium]
MLKDVIDLQQNAVTKLIELINLDKKDEITFKAPTGSGKTYMMADFMNQIISENSNVIFLVSTLSKGNLAGQNYDKFIQYADNGNFPYLKPYLINTEITGEESLFIPTDYNVYILPRDLYKKGGRLMDGAMLNFLNSMTSSLNGLNKKIYLIKDECHIATSNLDSISESHFNKIINFSATPNLKRGQAPDVEITEDEAVQAKLIKQVEIVEDEYDVDDALNKLEEIKDDYINLLGVNPCLIIQISNKDKAYDELSNNVFSALSKHQKLKWMLILDKESDCNTNDVFKSKKLPVSKWKNYAKEDKSTIDVIIFKMVISEGWDIPRACMLCQVRKSQSEQLDKQVMGRVRRNPRLLDFENLSEKAQKLATTAWVWGMSEEGKGKSYAVKLFDEPSDITNVVKLKTTRLKKLTEKVDFNLNKFIDSQDNLPKCSNIFELYRKLNKSDDSIKQMCYEYADMVDKWWKFNDNIDAIIIESNKYTCDYSKSMEIVKDEQGKEKLTSFPEASFYIDNENYVPISDWVWKKKNGSKTFSFDSNAEMEWARILEKLSMMVNCNNQKVIKQIICGKSNPNAKNLLKDVLSEKINPTEKFLWGKNYITNSEIKYEYYLDGTHFSYPDFIMMDSYGR